MTVSAAAVAVAVAVVDDNEDLTDQQMVLRRHSTHDHMMKLESKDMLQVVQGSFPISTNINIS